MSHDATPPAWAEHLLRLAVGAGEFDHLSGDLLEQYRVTVLPARGPRGADRWYVLQVLGFVWRGARGWALLFALGFLARTAFDWLVPTQHFYDRALVTTITSASILFIAAFWPAWRSGSVLAGPLFGLATTALAAPLQITGTLALLAIWHDPGTQAAISGSGGLDEVFALPFLVMLPAIVIGTIAGLLGAALASLRRPPALRA